MATVYLHIGLNKTGTSSLQDFFSLNHDALLEKAGICYPTSGRDGPAHHELSYWLKAEINRGSKEPKVGSAGKKLLKEIRNASTVVISSEDFHTQGAAGIEYLKRLLHKHDVRVVLYMREHVSYLASWYQRNVRSTRLSCSFDNFYRFVGKPLWQTADRWVEAFGARNVTVRLYERPSLKSGDIIEDFADIIQLEDLSRFNRKPSDSNPSVSGNLLFIKRLINAFCDQIDAPNFATEFNVLSELKPTFRGNMYVPERIVEHIGAMFADDRAELKTRFGIQIAPRAGAYPGHLSPDLASLREDWDLVMGKASQQGMRLAEFSGAISLGSGLALLPERFRKSEADTFA